MAKRAWAKKVSERTRQRRHRGGDEREPADELPLGNGDATVTSRGCHAVSPDNRREGKGEEASPSGDFDKSPSGEGRPRATPPGGDPLPPNFAVPQEWIEEARELRAAQALPVAALAFQAEKFGHHQLVKAARSADWHASWLNWALEARASPEAAVLAAAAGPAPPAETEPIAHQLGDAGDRLAEQLPAHEFRSWFGKLTAELDADGSVTLSVPSKFHYRQLSERYEAEIRAAWPGRQVRNAVADPSQAAPAAEAGDEGADRARRLAGLPQPEPRSGVAAVLHRPGRPGDFLCAVLRNDLKDAVVRADHINLPLLRAIVVWLDTEAPANAWGSVEKFETWLEG